MVLVSLIQKNMFRCCEPSVDEEGGPGDAALVDVADYEAGEYESFRVPLHKNFICREPLAEEKLFAPILYWFRRFAESTQKGLSRIFIDDRGLGHYSVKIGPRTLHAKQSSTA